MGSINPYGRVLMNVFLHLGSSLIDDMERKNSNNKQVKLQSIPRGIRNNNPLNIRIGNTWLGERDQPIDHEFEEFVDIRYGYRAAFVILRRYIRRYKKNTITHIVSTWAPASENNTQKYIDFVSQKMGIANDLPILYEDKETMVQLVAAMQLMECGVPADMDKVSRGYEMA